MVNACHGRIVTSATVTPDIPATTVKLTMVDLDVEYGLLGREYGLEIDSMALESLKI